MSSLSLTTMDGLPLDILHHIGNHTCISWTQLKTSHHSHCRGHPYCRLRWQLQLRTVSTKFFSYLVPPFPRTAMFLHTYDALQPFFQQVIDYEANLCRCTTPPTPTATIPNHLPFLNIYLIQFTVPKIPHLLLPLATNALPHLPQLRELNLIVTQSSYLWFIPRLVAWWPPTSINPIKVLRITDCRTPVSEQLHSTLNGINNLFRSP